MKRIILPKKNCGLRFEEALERSPELKKHSTSNGKGIDLGNTTALLLYNRLILQEFLGLDFSLPVGFLIPTICSRWEFLKWCLKDIDKTDQARKILEIGTGASAILALMLAKIGYKVEATETNEEAYKSAQINAELNNLSTQIRLFKADKNIIKGLFFNLNKFEAIITNPPQYDINYYEGSKRSKKGFTGKKSELVGGKLGYEFIVQLLIEVKEFKDHPPIFFQLISLKLSSKITEFLENNGFDFIKQENEIGTRKRVYYKVI
ncbi:MAG: RlmF-related methyltransferase [Candidatus Hodarchaeota archaeon]